MDRKFGFTGGNKDGKRKGICNIIKGAVCGIKVEQIEEPLMQKIRWLDKLVDELAKGKPMEKILR